MRPHEVLKALIETHLAQSPRGLLQPAVVQFLVGVEDNTRLARFHVVIDAGGGRLGDGLAPNARSVVQTTDAALEGLFGPDETAARALRVSGETEPVRVLFDCLARRARGRSIVSVRQKE